MNWYKGVKTAQRIVVRRGPIDANGAYFASPGNSTYYDADTDDPNVQQYDISAANIADTQLADVVVPILQQTLRDQSLTPQERSRVEDLLGQAVAGDPYIDYMANDELPIPAAARQLGWDGILVWENDDYGNPSSIFLWNVQKAVPLANRQQGVKV